ncbi:hypothetical protein NI389_07440 [Pseudoalteromonas xiamenensis]|uniref:hypothetical protein n=1 Tax=Pseudoalteromonas xiamenensis TaxID=882626 RepID=UPI0027E5BB07|nr:hypothetical protein [Pseudoalteromonas xiamenensis]WMN61206.1 hypothetical protein NI389_07440 [Pseudoalteromonas xiamenensis]
MKMFRVLIAVSLFSTLSVYAQECDFESLFPKSVKKTQQQFNMNNGGKLSMTQWLNVETISESRAKIASNIICQSLQGASYTGEDEEWSQFIQGAARGLVDANATNIEFTLVGTDDATYHGKLDNREYQFIATMDDYKQMMRNITLLNKSRNQVITVSISGNTVIAEEINKEYRRIVSQLN